MSSLGMDAGVSYEDVIRAYDKSDREEKKGIGMVELTTNPMHLEIADSMKPDSQAERDAARSLGWSPDDSTPLGQF